MNLPFFYIDFLDAQLTSYTLSEETSKHIVQVLRKGKDDLLQLTDGKGNVLTASIVDDHKKKCVVKKISFESIPPVQHKITIAISLIKNTSRFEWFLEKATEIGVSTIMPLICHRTEKQHFRLDRMKGILISAMLQSKQAWLPELQEPVLYQDVIKKNAAANKFIAHCDDDTTKIQLASLKKSSSSIILIGPEGDFTNEEIALAQSNHYTAVSLGNNRLRTETAGVVAVSLLNV
jgi:16S rRNA (uracil1498-N3)-methyltransferase